MSDIVENRMKICMACPLYKRVVGGAVCNGNLWLHPLTGKTSSSYKEGYRKGCGCSLKYKLKSVNNKCPLDKW